MESSIASPYLLASIFFIVALAYSSVGLGGGSSYTALMAIFGVNYIAIPNISLLLNILATSIGSFNYIRQGHAKIRLILPFFISSIPMAYLGGALKISADLFYWILLTSLIFVIIRIYFWQQTSLKFSLNNVQKLIISITTGAILGLISGIVGIGGGIYLIPLIIILGLGTEKEAAACGVLFVWANSLAGLVARYQHQFFDAASFVPLAIAVLAGSTIGSYLGSTKLQPATMQKLLGMITIVAVVFLIKKITLA